MVVLLLIVAMAAMATLPFFPARGIVTEWPRRKTRGAKRLEPDRRDAGHARTIPYYFLSIPSI